ncbi:MAG: YdeI/OmpD-associated family protein [Maritimibacter sp.]
MLPQDALSFPDSAAFAAWLEKHHDTAEVLWLKIYKKGSGVPSLDWNDCVIEALCWGWIDGQKKSLDESAYLQRLTPRRAKSAWSKRNVDHVEKLISQGRMQPSGMAHVRAAKADGRWDAAYAGGADFEIPKDFLDALDKSPKARAKFDTLSRSALYAMYHQLHSAKKPETRVNRTAKMIDRLARGEPPV